MSIDQSSQVEVANMYAQTRKLTIIAQDPSVQDQGRVVTAQIDVPAEKLWPGPTGYRVHVIDYDASTIGSNVKRQSFCLDQSGKIFRGVFFAAKQEGRGQRSSPADRGTHQRIR